MTKYICIKEIEFKELNSFNSTAEPYRIDYESPKLNIIYYILYPSKIFDENLQLTEDLHHFICNVDEKISFMCTIPVNKLLTYLIPLSEFREIRINKILEL